MEECSWRGAPLQEQQGAFFLCSLAGSLYVCIGNKTKYAAEC